MFSKTLIMSFDTLYEFGPFGHPWLDLKFTLSNSETSYWTDKDRTSRLYSKPASSPTKAIVKPATVEDMGKEISEALDQPRQVDVIAEEVEDDESLFNKLFGMLQEKVNVCTRCKEKKAKNDTVLLCNIIYPESKEEQKFTFEEVVCSSMCPEQTTPAWCEQCRKYQTTRQIRNLKTLPNVLSLNAGMVS